MGKRANGEGSIYPRKDGRWAASISVGKGKRKHFLGATRAAVAAQLADALKKQNDGLPVKFENKRFDAFINEWLANHKAALQPRTWTRYEQLIRCHALPALGKLQLERITPAQIQRLYRQMEEGGSSGGTVRQLHAVLHKAFKQAVSWNYMARNVADAVTPPKPGRLEMKTLTPEQARSFLEAAKGDRLEALYILALTTGMRQGELLGLRWQDVDLVNGSVHIQTTMQRTKDGFEFSDTKTRKSRRQVMLTDLAKDALERHRVNQTAERLLAPTTWQSQGLVFTNQTGGPIEASWLLRRSYRLLLERAELPEIRFHDLRHTAATLLLGQGIHPKIVSEMLGHSTINITLDLYSHVTPTMQMEAAAAMNSLLT